MSFLSFLFFFFFFFVNEFSSGWRKVCVWAQSCLTLCHPIDCSPPGSSVYRNFYARILEWVAISSPMGSSWPRDQTHLSCVGRHTLYHWATWEPHLAVSNGSKMSWQQQRVDLLLGNVESLGSLTRAEIVEQYMCKMSSWHRDSRRLKVGREGRVNRQWLSKLTSK